MRQVVYCSYLLVGVSWLFPPALLVTIPIAVIATIIAGIATVTARAVQAGPGQGATTSPPAPTAADSTVEGFPPAEEMTMADLRRLHEHNLKEERRHMDRPGQPQPPAQKQPDAPEYDPYGM